MKEMQLSRKTRYTRMVLRNSLLELMQQKPISKVTIKELCERADINRTTFYAHYRDQYDLLRQIQDETLAWAEGTLTRILDQADQNEMLELLEGVFQYIADNRNHIQVLMSEQGDIDFQKRLFTLIYRQCEMTPSAANADLASKELYFVFVVNGSVGLIQHWLKNGLDTPVREMAEVIYNMASRLR